MRRRAHRLPNALDQAEASALDRPVAVASRDIVLAIIGLLPDD